MPASIVILSEPTTDSQSLSSSDLSRYSYNPPQSLRDMIKRRGELEAQRAAQFGPPGPPRKVRVTRPPNHRFTTDFTDDELSRVLKCVSCGNRWTVRKGAIAKMRHIQSCAKKNGFNDEDIRTLIRAELEAPEGPKPQKKPKSSGVTNTLLEDTLGDTGATKNKRKQAQQTTTLRDPAENREAIRAKAEAILKSKGTKIRDLYQEPELVDIFKKSDSTMDRIQMFDFSNPPPATQEFGRSKLGKQTSSAILSALPDSSPKMSTTSKLVGTTSKGRRLDLFTGEETDCASVSPVALLFKMPDNKPQPISLHSSIDIPFERLSLEPLNFRDEDIHSDHGSEVSCYNDSAILHYNQKEDELGDWNDDYFIHDDAILHFNPGKRDQSIPRTLTTTTNTPCYTCPSNTLHPAEPTPQDPAGQVKGRKVKKPRSRKKEADVQPTEVDDEGLRSAMLNVIREDDELYHQILRYDVRFLYFLSHQWRGANRKHTAAGSSG